MANDISITISAKDDYTQAINTMKTANQSFSKDLTGLQAKLTELNKTKAVLKVDTDKALNALKKAEDQYKSTGKAADKMKLQLAGAKYENANRNLSLVSDHAKQAEKDIVSFTDTVNRTANLPKIKGQATELVLKTLNEVAVTRIGSALGQEAGIMVDSVSSMAITGATIGSLAGPMGTAVGAVVGGGLGYVQGQNEIFKNKDEAFKNYYSGLYNDTMIAQNQSLSNGTNIAAIKEADKIPFSTLLGSPEKADSFMASMTEFAESTPFSYNDLSNISKALLAYGYKQKEIIPLLQNIGDAGAALGISNDDIKNIAVTIGGIQASKYASLGSLNTLEDKHIDVWGALTKEFNKSKDAMKQMAQDGLIPGERAAKAIANSLGKDFNGSMGKESKTYSGLKDKIEKKKGSLDSSMGDGYFSVRKVGMQEQDDWLSGTNGKLMKDAYDKIGQWKASLENLSEQYERDAISSVMSGNISNSFNNSKQKSKLIRLAGEYRGAQLEYNEGTKHGDQKEKQKANANMGRIIAEAQAIAKNEYNASDGAQLELETQKTIAENIKNDAGLQTMYWDAGYTMMQQFTKGMDSVVKESENLPYLLQSPQQRREESYKTFVNWVHKTFNGEDGNTKNDRSQPTNSKQKTNTTSAKDTKKQLPYWASTSPNPLPSPSSNAYGLTRVPYDNYPALLHEGERVLTAGQSRSLDKKKGASVRVTGNTFVVREEGDIERIAHEIAKLFNSAYQLAEG